VNERSQTTTSRFRWLDVQLLKRDMLRATRLDKLLSTVAFFRDEKHRAGTTARWRAKLLAALYPAELRRVWKIVRAVGRLSWRAARGATAAVRSYRQQWQRKGYWRTDGVYVRPTTVNRRSPAYRRR
jgi:anti-sigma-K factor RskA